MEPLAVGEEVKLAVNNFTDDAPGHWPWMFAQLTRRNLSVPRSLSRLLTSSFSCCGKRSSGNTLVSSLNVKIDEL